MIKSPSFKKQKFHEELTLFKNENKNEKRKIKLDVSVTSEWISSSDDNQHKELNNQKYTQKLKKKSTIAFRMESNEIEKLQ